MYGNLQNITGGGTNNPVYPGKKETIYPGKITNNGENSIDAKIQAIDDQLKILYAQYGDTSGHSANGPVPLNQNVMKQYDELNRNRQELMRQKNYYGVQNEIGQERWNAARKAIGGMISNGGIYS